MGSSGMGRQLVGQQHLFTAAGFVLAFVLVGCGGAPKQVGDENNWANSDSSSSKSSDTGSSEKWSGSKESSKGGEESDLNEDQQKQMEVALRRGGEKAANCPEV